MTRDLSIALPTNDAPLVLQWMLPALTRKPLSDAATSRLFAGQRLGWAYSEDTARIYPVLCKVSDKNVNCLEETDDVIEKEIQRYDPRSVIFYRTLLIND